jgi:hypothetical protein
MDLKCYPTEVECVDKDDNNRTIFRVEMEDEHSAMVSIPCSLNEREWPTISSEIQQCLNQILKR